jgi:hypothetical protein
MVLIAWDMVSVDTVMNFQVTLREEISGSSE